MLQGNKKEAPVTRLKNPALWLAFGSIVCGSVLQYDFFAAGSTQAKLIGLVGTLLGAAGSLFFDAGWVSKPTPERANGERE